MVTKIHKHIHTYIHTYVKIKYRNMGTIPRPIISLKVDILYSTAALESCPTLKIIINMGVLSSIWLSNRNPTNKGTFSTIAKLYILEN